MATDHFSILDYQFTGKRRLGLGTAQAMVSSTSTIRGKCRSPLRSAGALQKTSKLDAPNASRQGYWPAGGGEKVCCFSQGSKLPSGERCSSECPSAKP